MAEAVRSSHLVAIKGVKDGIPLYPTRDGFLSPISLAFDPSPSPEHAIRCTPCHVFCWGSPCLGTLHITYPLHALIAEFALS